MTRSIFTNDPRLCPICRFHHHEEQYVSSLGITPICSECYWNQAEHEYDIHKAVKAAGTDQDQLANLKTILKSATCWVGVDEGYLPLAAWEKRKSERQVAVVPVDNDDLQLDFQDEQEHLRHVMEKMVFATRRFNNIGDRSSVRRSFFHRVWMGLFYGKPAA